MTMQWLLFSLASIVSCLLQNARRAENTQHTSSTPALKGPINKSRDQSSGILNIVKDPYTPAHYQDQDK